MGCTNESNYNEIICSHNKWSLQWKKLDCTHNSKWKLEWVQTHTSTHKSHLKTQSFSCYFTTLVYSRCHSTFNVSWSHISGGRKNALCLLHSWPMPCLLDSVLVPIWPLIQGHCVVFPVCQYWCFLLLGQLCKFCKDDVSCFLWKQDFLKIRCRTWIAAI